MSERSASERIERIKIHHRRNGTGQAWEASRFLRLCRVMQVPQDEIAALFAIPQTAMSQWLKLNKIPPYIALHFHTLERAFYEAKK